MCLMWFNPAILKCLNFPYIFQFLYKFAFNFLKKKVQIYSTLKKIALSEFILKFQEFSCSSYTAIMKFWWTFSIFWLVFILKITIWNKLELLVRILRRYILKIPYHPEFMKKFRYFVSFWNENARWRRFFWLDFRWKFIKI